MNVNERKRYERDGYIILKNAVDKKECQRFINEAVIPALKKRNINLTNRKQFKRRKGDMILGNNNSNHPINKKYKDSRWPALYNSSKLINSLNEIHGLKRWSWYDVTEEGQGWIHLRYPNTKKNKWEIPKYGWHVDGEDNGKLDPYKSVTVLPLVTKIGKGYGGTALCRGSHKHINYWIHKLQNREDIYDYIYRKIDKKDIIEANGDAGDILIMHPHLVHASSDALNKPYIPVRVTFNMGVKNTNKCLV